MGWGNCGTDSQGRSIGYIFDTICDHPDCTQKINRGLAYACGGMHGEDVYNCEKYFCYEHLTYHTIGLQLCQECSELLCKDCRENDFYHLEECGGIDECEHPEELRSSL